MAREIGLVGCGRWGANILRDLRTLGCEVHVCARSAASTARAREGGATSIVGRPEDLPAVDGIVVATLTRTHAEVVSALLAQREVPVYVEKPLCTSVDEAERLVAAGSGRLFVMDKWRYHPGVLELARIAREGELGAVTSIHSRRVTDAHRHADVDTVWMHAPHDLAIALEILGELPEPVFATAERSQGERVGLIGTLGTRPAVTIEVSRVAPAHRRELRMVCEDGVALLDGGWAEEVLVRRDGADTERRALAGELPLLAELRAFVEHLDGGPAPRSSAQDAALIVRRIAELGALAA